jgi:hypothetical protein
VYGPVQIELKPDFLRELMEVIMTTEVPLIVGEILIWSERLLKNLLGM